MTFWTNGPTIKYNLVYEKGARIMSNISRKQKIQKTGDESVIRTCLSCKYYIPHYIKVGNEFKVSAFGHCTYPQIKSRTADKLACAYYKER